MGFRLVVEDGAKSAIEPCACPPGARVEARDLFAATPARLKFLRSDRAEALAAADAVKRLAMAAPDVRFSFATDLGSPFDWPACGPGEAGSTERLRQALSDDFASNSVALDGRREGLRLTGRIGLPTYSRPNASQQFLFVNGRAVRDKTLAGALRGAYLDFLPPDRHAVAALFVECACAEVDVNVHPAKAEVRFRDAQAVRALIVGAIKQRLGEALHRASTTGGSATILAMRPPQAYRGASYSPRWDWRASPAAPRLAEPRRRASQGASPKPRLPPRRRLLSRARATSPLRLARRGRRCTRTTSSPRRATESSSSTSTRRMSASSMRSSSVQREQGAIERQTLLTPLVVDLDPGSAALIEANAAELAALGLIVEGFGPGAVMVREAPAAIAQGDLASLVRDLAADLGAEDGAQTLARRLDQRLATFACHHSVRSGRTLKPEEMNALLREMEATPGAGQCNHGRPTYVELKLSDIERLFGRK